MDPPFWKKRDSHIAMKELDLQNSIIIFVIQGNPSVSKAT